MPHNYANRRKYARITIFGAGLIGLTCAMRLVERGAAVTLVDRRRPGRGASWAAAGMLAPAYEALIEEDADARLVELALEGARAWPAFAARLAGDVGCDLNYRRSGTVAAPPSPRDALDKLTKVGVEAELIGGADLRRLEPALSPDLTAAVRLPTDGWVDSRAVVDGLIVWLHANGAVFSNTAPEACDAELWATGWRADNVRPVGGQMLALADGPGRPAHVVRSGDVYIVPQSGRVLIGATSEPGVSEPSPVEADLGRLHREAAALCPALEDAPRIEAWAGVRPQSLDNAPFIGRTGPKSFVATGHYRNGVLLAPITADIIADAILDDHVSPLAAAFRPDRSIEPVV